MTNLDLENLWRQKADETLIAAGNEIETYNQTTAQIISEELVRRGLPKPSRLSQNAATIDSPIVIQAKVIDFDMPFGSMVLFMIKWALAAIPAIIILAVIGTIVGALFSGILMSIFHH